MKTASTFVSQISILVIYALVILLPLVFTTLTSEYYDSAKFFLLSIAVLVLLIFLGLKFLTEGKMEIRKTSLDLLLVSFLAVALVSTLISPSRLIALFGLMPKLYGSFFYVLEITLLYFLVNFNLKNLKQINLLTHLMLGSGVILAVFSLLTYFKTPVPIPLIGSFASSAVYLALILPFSLRLLFTQPILGVLVNLIFTLIF